MRTSLFFASSLCNAFLNVLLPAHAELFEALHTYFSRHFCLPKRKLATILLFNLFRLQSTLLLFSLLVAQCQHSQQGGEEGRGRGLWQQFNMAKLINSWAWYAAQILAQALEQTRQRRQFRCQMTQEKRANNTQIGWEIWTKDRLEEWERRRERKEVREQFKDQRDGQTKWRENVVATKVFQSHFC